MITVLDHLHGRVDDDVARRLAGACVVMMKKVVVSDDEEVMKVVSNLGFVVETRVLRPTRTARAEKHEGTSVPCWG